MTALTVQANPDDVKAVLDLVAHIKNGVTRATVRAINRTADGAKTNTAKQVAARITPTQKAIKESLFVSRASYSNPSGKLAIQGKNIPLIEFSARQTMTGVSFQIWREGTREKYRHAFIRTMPSGHEGVFERKMRGGKPVGRLPIEERFGPSVPTVVEKTPGLLDGVLDEAGDRYLRELAYQVDYLLKLEEGPE